MADHPNETLSVNVERDHEVQPKEITQEVLVSNSTKQSMAPTHREGRGSDQMSTNPLPATAESDMQTPRSPGTERINEKESSCSSSTSSDDTNEDDFFQLDDAILGNPVLSTSDGGNEQMLSPPVQAMVREEDAPLNPNRIPSSVFARTKSTSPMEWSVTSNESLFSINVGNSSFSKDHYLLYGKSGELGSPNDPMAPLPPLPRSSPSSSPVAAVKDAAPKGKTVDEHAGPDRDGDGGTNNSHSLSRQSDASTTSFAFPILTGEGISSDVQKDGHPSFARQNTARLHQPAVPQAEMAAPKAAEVPKAEEAPPTGGQWFPWCACCPFCC